MKYSQLFVKTRRNVPADAVSANHKLLIQAGFIDQLSAGIFNWLPFGLRTLRKIENIIREELDAVGANEVSMPALIQKSNWEKTDRWNKVDILFKTTSRTDKEYGLGFSHEETVTPLGGLFLNSYKDLPIAIYQIQTKFRDELRAKSGLLRGREFGMKDLYSFHETVEDFQKYYEKIIKTYLKIFVRMGLDKIKITEASGGSFTKKFSHEFNVLTPAGEIELVYCDQCIFTQNIEITQNKSGNRCPKCHKGKLFLSKAIEVGNIFDLGNKFAENFGVVFLDREGKKQKPVMGCYGIGTTRLVGTIVEKYHDDRGIIWPEAVAPFKFHLVSLPGGEDKAQKTYQQLLEKDQEVLWDDRQVSAGVKFADCDLIGVPTRLVISAKTGDKIEIKKRTETNSRLITSDEIFKLP